MSFGLKIFLSILWITIKSGKSDREGRFVLETIDFQIDARLKILPEHMRIGRNAPNERVLLARSDNKKNWSARAIRKKVMSCVLLIIQIFSLVTF